MSSFFELRIYQVFPNKMYQWVEFMEKTIIPFQINKGMKIIGTFKLSQTDNFFLENNQRKMKTVKKNTYVWIRKFDSLNEKKNLYKKVYESKEWINDIAPIVDKLIDRNSIVVHNLKATKTSKIK